MAGTRLHKAGHDDPRLNSEANSERYKSPMHGSYNGAEMRPALRALDARLEALAQGLIQAN